MSCYLVDELTRAVQWTSSLVDELTRAVRS